MYVLSKEVERETHATSRAVHLGQSQDSQRRLSTAPQTSYEERTCVSLHCCTAADLAMSGDGQTASSSTCAVTK
eukprot:5467747-Amphidinium_carterae.1